MVTKKKIVCNFPCKVARSEVEVPKQVVGNELLAEHSSRSIRKAASLHSDNVDDGFLRVSLIFVLFFCFIDYFPIE